MGLARILNRPGQRPEDLLEKYADILLLFMTGSAYRLTDRDESGREYEVDVKVVPDGD
jgi:hypothetical protein